MYIDMKFAPVFWCEELTVEEKQYFSSQKHPYQVWNPPGIAHQEQFTKGKAAAVWSCQLNSI